MEGNFADLKELLSRTDRIKYLFTVAYFASYLTRTNFAAIISEIETETGYTKAALALCVTGLFFSYGFGQLISGYLGDRILPKSLVFAGLLSSSMCNLLMPLCGKPVLMALLWTINGFFQAFLWPPIVLLLTILVEEKEYQKAVMMVNSGGSVGSVCVYLLSPLLMAVYGWKSVFLFCGILGMAVSFLWLFCCPSVRPTMIHNEIQGRTNIKGILTVEMIGILIAIVIQGALRDGISTWMPTNIEETFHLNGLLSVLSGAVLPLFSTVSFRVALYIHKKWFRNPVTCSAVLFFAAGITTVLLTIFSDVNAILSVVLFTLVSGFMNGINLMLVSLLPSYFIRTGSVSTISGMMNSCTYVGSAVVTYGIGTIVDQTGWELVTLIWCLAAIAGCLICLISSRTKWSREWFTS